VSAIPAGLVRAPVPSSLDVGLPTRSEIEGWIDAVNDLSSSAASYRAAAENIEITADSHVRQLSAPGGSEWTGRAADTAQESSYADRGVVYRSADHMREMAKVADRGAANLLQVRHRALDAISQAEADDFRVGDDLTVTDTRRYTGRDINAYVARQANAEEHQGDIARWAGVLAAEDADIGAKLGAGAAALTDMIPEQWASGIIQSADYTVRPEGPPPKPRGPADALSVKNAEDVHRVVDPLPPGRNPGVKTLPTPEAILALYGQLTENSVPGLPSTYPGQWRVLEDGTKVGLRQTSKFGGPTVEIWYPDGTKTDVHLAERPKGPSPAPVPVPAPAPAPAPIPLPAPEPSPVAIPDSPSGPSLGSQPVVTPEEGGVVAVIGGIGIGIIAGVVELGKLVFGP
jgi:hypothetical protein